MILTPEWPAPREVRAAFTLRTGGVSAPPYDTLNIGAHVGDTAEAVHANRRILKVRLRLSQQPVWLRQVHGTGVVSLHDTAELDPAPQGDAAVSHAGGGICAIQVADCMPVLFAARDGTMVGAAHAGWRGLAAGVLEATVASMGVDPASLLAWLGPAIGPAHFEVGDDVRAAFLSAVAGPVQLAEVSTAFVPNASGRWQCDLYALARQRLKACGVQSVHGGGWCTFADSARFFSYRRDGQCGRMAALIWLDTGH